MKANGVSQLRVVLVADDLDRALGFFRDGLGLAEAEAIAGPEGAQVVILTAGRATLELANAAQARFIADVETDGRPGPQVRLAFEVADTAAATQALTAAGAGLIAPPVRTPWNSLNARLAGPTGVEVTLFQELDANTVHSGADLVGVRVDALGGEAGVLTRLVQLATEHGATGQLPFAAVVAREGEVVGAGVNTALAELDPAGHAEVVAIRDAAGRTGSIDLTGVVVYSSCEPCPICRTVAAAAGVREIVFAAGAELVPAEIDADPQATRRLIDAVTSQLPAIARAGTTNLSPEQLAAQFRAYADATAR